MQVIEEHRLKFLKEMDAKAIAKALCGLRLIPEPVTNSILQSMSTENANVELLTFLEAKASENQMEAIFKFASEQTDYGRMSEFATNILQKLQQGLYTYIDVCTYTFITHTLSPLLPPSPLTVTLM